MDFETVRQQIGAMNLMAVGARTFVADAEKRSLMFQVGSRRGLLEKVIVTLEPSDYYSVRYVAMRKKDYAVVAEDEMEFVPAASLGAVVRKFGDRA